MILVIGGRNQGKTDFVNKNFSEKRILNGFHEFVKDKLKIGENVDLTEIYSNFDVVISDELGCGLVPVEKFDRDWRETTGRYLCEIAKNSDKVYRVFAGIAVRIK